MQITAWSPDTEDGRSVPASVGGAARMGTIAKQIRATSQRSLWLDSGDSFQGAPVFNEYRGEVEFRAATLMGMDGAVIGNHEFDLGTDNLVQQASKWAGFPLLAANYNFTPQVNPQRLGLQDVALPYYIYDVQGLRVG